MDILKQCFKIVSVRRCRWYGELFYYGIWTLCWL